MDLLSAFQLIFIAVMTKFLCIDPPLNAGINPFTRKVSVSTPQRRSYRAGRHIQTASWGAAEKAIMEFLKRALPEVMPLLTAVLS